MEADFGEPGPLEVALERARNSRGLDWSAKGAGEDKVVFVPGGAGPEPLFHLCGAVLAKVAKGELPEAD